MASDGIDEQYVRVAAAAQGLPLPEERVAAVVAQLQRIAQTAAPVLALELRPEDEPGPAWRP